MSSDRKPSLFAQKMRKLRMAGEDRSQSVGAACSSERTCNSFGMYFQLIIYQL